MLLQTQQAEIETIIGRYASKRSAVLPLLYLAQDAYGYLSPEAIREVAEILELPPTQVFEVVGFYTLFYDRPVGTWMLQVCDDVPCCYVGAEELITALKATLGIKEDETSADGMFTLQRVKCLAACDRAPVVQANLDYIYDVTAERAEELLANLRTRAAEAKARGVSGRCAEDYALGAKGLEHIAREAPYQPRAFDGSASPAPKLTPPAAPPETAAPAATPEVAKKHEASPL
ncbi:MAG: NAD(P)H-dependent oxidoreductase subunit E [Candidatus Viridilinea halotolerans]|uniref:NAD(P)H-dependent oxidoreductase subunit E n=1 Tax=Candidatus Viridilinea halotolerans TaxID=2491704 RepID=A0A426U4K2_9CHLR|nr:MAG: NAD(P)H-dependent oxidoreductase subunit E [Candidatus Viridilinea halotolerans]